MTAQPVSRLRVVEVVRGSLMLFRRRGAEFLRSLAVSAAGVGLVEYFFQQNPDDASPIVTVTMLALYVMLYTLFAVTCHRLTLLRPGKVPAFGQLVWSWRETRFFGWSLGICILAAAPIVPLVFASAITGNDTAFGWMWYVITVPFYYLLARMSLVLPATAVDRRPELVWAWKLSRHCHWQLFFVAGLLPLVFSAALDLIQREDLSIPEALVIHFIGLVLLAFEVVLLSLAYKSLTRGSRVAARI